MAVLFLAFIFAGPKIIEKINGLQCKGTIAWN